jgi:septal ring factor EnvC (AmiA/AmiB activator)
MSAVPFDTLKFARHLEASGLAASVAVGTAEALADAMSGADLATRTDITEVRSEIAATRSDLKAEIAATRTEIAATRSDLKAEIAATRTELAATRTELKADIAVLRTEFKSEIAATRIELKNDIELLRRDVTIKFDGMMVLAVGILLTAIRYLPPHP